MREQTERIEFAISGRFNDPLCDELTHFVFTGEVPKCNTRLAVKADGGVPPSLVLSLDGKGAAGPEETRLPTREAERDRPSLILLGKLVVGVGFEPTPFRL